MLTEGVEKHRPYPRTPSRVAHSQPFLALQNKG